jgi:hypothetical protein
VTTIGEEVTCRREGCGRTYSEHQRYGGGCPDTGCPGFLWIVPHGPPVGSYTDPPQRP